MLTSVFSANVSLGIMNLFIFPKSPLSQKSFFETTERLKILSWNHLLSIYCSTQYPYRWSCIKKISFTLILKGFYNGLYFLENFPTVFCSLSMIYHCFPVYLATFCQYSFFPVCFCNCIIWNIWKTEFFSYKTLPILICFVYCLCLIWKL